MRHADHLKVALHETVLAWGSVLHDIGIVKLDLFTTYHCRKVCLTYIRTLLLWDEYPFLTLKSVCLYDPLSKAGEYLVYIEPFSVNL